MGYFEEVKQELFTFKHLGEEIAPNGAHLIGRAPHIAPYAWLHMLCPVLNMDEVATLEAELKTKLPVSYRDFLMKCSNGLGLFVARFSLYGLRKQGGRSIDAGRQPFSPVTSNRDERPRNAKPSYFFIGSYNWDGSRLYIDKDTNEVHYCDRRDATSLQHWDSFETMLVSEVKRICNLFGDDGVVKDPDLYTTPIPRKWG